MFQLNGAAVKALIPKIELPKYFKITSAPLADKTVRIEATLNAKGGLSYVAIVPTETPSMLDVIKAFPKVDTESFSPLVKGFLGLVSLPTRWELECTPRQGKEGFRLTLDVYQAGGAKHWEKEFEVTSMQLSEFVDIVGWVKEANKVGR